MLASFFASMISPKMLLGAAAAIILGIGLYTVVSFIDDYGALKVQVATSQQNLNTAIQAAKDQTAASVAQQAVDQATLDAVRQHDADQATALAVANDNIASLQALGKPTNADVECSKSPYVSTILNRLRQQRPAPPKSQPHPKTGNASPAHRFYHLS